MKAMAAGSFATDSHPDFWREAANLTARWFDALSSDSLDWNVLGALREEARSKKEKAGVWLFTFCNGLESSYVALREASLLNTNEEKA